MAHVSQHQQPAFKSISSYIAKYYVSYVIMSMMHDEQGLPYLIRYGTSKESRWIFVAMMMDACFTINFL